MEGKTMLAALAAPMVTNVLGTLGALLVAVGGPAINAADANGIAPGEIAKYGAAGLMTIITLVVLNAWRQGNKEHVEQVDTSEDRHVKQLDQVLERSDSRAQRMVDLLIDEAKANRDFQLEISRSQAHRDGNISSSMRTFGDKLDHVAAGLEKLTGVQERIERSVSRRPAADYEPPARP